VNKYHNMLQNLKSHFSSTEYICTTADIWSSAHRSFIGMTAHWICDDAHGNLQRKLAALACLRFKGKHSYDRIAAGISQTHDVCMVHICMFCVDYTETSGS